MSKEIEKKHHQQKRSQRVTPEDLPCMHSNCAPDALHSAGLRWIIARKSSLLFFVGPGPGDALSVVVVVVVVVIFSPRFTPNPPRFPPRAPGCCGRLTGPLAARKPPALLGFAWPVPAPLDLRSADCRSISATVPTCSFRPGAISWPSSSREALPAW